MLGIITIYPIRVNGADGEADSIGKEAKLSASTCILPVPRIEEVKTPGRLCLLVRMVVLVYFKSDEVEI